MHADITGPHPSSQDDFYFLKMMDIFRRWPETVANPDINALTVAKVFYNQWTTGFGSPSEITTDQGRQSEIMLFQSLSYFLGIKRNKSTLLNLPYHPQSNGMFEEFYHPL